MFKICYNQPSQKVFERFPGTLKNLIEIAQGTLDGVVIGLDPSAIKTGGFRCPSYNTEIGGTPDSEHIWGLATDWRKKESTLAIVPELRRLGFFVKVEENCIHVGFHG